MYGAEHHHQAAAAVGSAIFCDVSGVNSLALGLREGRERDTAAADCARVNEAGQCAAEVPMLQGDVCARSIRGIRLGSDLELSRQGGVPTGYAIRGLSDDRWIVVAAARRRELGGGVDKRRLLLTTSRK